jgi:hypothetical protein
VPWEAALTDTKNHERHAETTPAPVEAPVF